MENIISYYYNLNVDKSSVVNNVFIIESNHEVYIAKEIKNLEEFNKVNSLLLPGYYSPLINKEGQNHFNYNDKNYCIFKATEPSNLKGEDLALVPIAESKDIDYTEIWSNNIEYFIKHLMNMETHKVDSINNLNYYIGLSENAIIVNEKAKKFPGSARISISHYRMHSPNYDLTFKDPSNLMIDYISRDIAEYTKASFFNDGITEEEFMNMINKYNITEKELLFLIARLLYPNYYFDTLSDNNIEKQQKIIEKRKKYEVFLSNIFRQIKTTNININIPWLNRL